MSTSRTPGPWTADRQPSARGLIAIIDPVRNVVARVPVGGELHLRRKMADAEFIVRAANAHDALVAALHDCATYLATSDDARGELAGIVRRALNKVQA